MEKLEMDDDTVPHAILSHRRQELTEKATVIIQEAEDRESMCERMRAYFQDFEPGMNFLPINTLK